MLNYITNTCLITCHYIQHHSNTWSITCHYIQQPEHPITCSITCSITGAIHVQLHDSLHSLTYHCMACLSSWPSVAIHTMSVLLNVVIPSRNRRSSAANVWHRLSMVQGFSMLGMELETACQMILDLRLGNHLRQHEWKCQAMYDNQGLCT